MYNPSPDDLALQSVEALEEMTRAATRDHTTALTVMATEFDESEKKIKSLKATPRTMSVEVIVRDTVGKHVETWESPAVDAAGMAAALAGLTRSAMSGEIVNRARRGVAELQARRSVLGRQIQQQQEAFYKLEMKLASALASARVRATQESSRYTNAVKHSGDNRAPRSMSERLGLDGAGAGEAK